MVFEKQINCRCSNLISHGETVYIKGKEGV